MIGWIIGIVVVLLIVCWVIGTYNGLIKGRIVVDEAFATMDVYLKKRYDLIPNLVETVKGYASHEKETLEKVISLRTGSYDAMTPEEKIQNDTTDHGSGRAVSGSESKSEFYGSES